MATGLHPSRDIRGSSETTSFSEWINPVPWFEKQWEREKNKSWEQRAFDTGLMLSRNLTMGVPMVESALTATQVMSDPVGTAEAVWDEFTGPGGVVPTGVSLALGGKPSARALTQGLNKAIPKGTIYNMLYKTHPKYGFAYRRGTSKSQLAAMEKEAANIPIAQAGPGGKVEPVRTPYGWDPKKFWDEAVPSGKIDLKGKGGRASPGEGGKILMQPENVAFHRPVPNRPTAYENVLAHEQSHKMSHLAPGKGGWPEYVLNKVQKTKVHSDPLKARTRLPHETQPWLHGTGSFRNFLSQHAANPTKPRSYKSTAAETLRSEKLAALRDYLLR